MTRTPVAAASALDVHEVAAPAARCAVVLWHGLGGDTRFLAPIAAALAAALPVRVLLPTLPAHAGAPPGPLAPADLGARTIEILDKAGIEAAILGGHSFGAEVACAAAATAPARTLGLVLLDGAIIERACADTVELKAEAEAARLGSPDAPSARDLVEAWSAAANTPAHEALKAVGAAGVPVLAVVASEPPQLEELRATGLRRLRSVVPYAAIERLDGAGHTDLVRDVRVPLRISQFLYDEWLL